MCSRLPEQWPKKGIIIIPIGGIKKHENTKHKIDGTQYLVEKIKVYNV